MKTFIFPTKDATISPQQPTYNFGQDEILGVGKLTVSSSRALIQFDVNPFSASIANGTISASSSFFLNLEVATSIGLTESQSLYAVAVSQSWLEGTGQWVQTNVNPQDGACWNFSSGPKLGLQWSSSLLITSSMSTTTITDTSVPVRFDVTPIVKSWISGTLVNNGLAIKLSDANEANASNFTNFKFFSSQTSTIYKPSLECSWDSQIYATGSLSASAPDTVAIGLKNLKNQYSPNTMNLIRLNVRDRFPIKTFTNTFTRYQGNQYLPQTTYYRIVDAITNRIMVPFDNFSKVSCDGQGGYFILNTTGLYSNRLYKIQIKVVTPTTNTIYDMNSTFLVRVV